jgi:parallel beta-helix repeat protein
MVTGMATEHSHENREQTGHDGHIARQVDLMREDAPGIAVPLKKRTAAVEKTIYVKPGGKTTRAGVGSITKAIQRAKPGTTIMLEPGVYTQNVVLNKKSDITIIGAPNQASIIAPVSGDAIYAQLSTNITVENVWLRAEGSSGTGLSIAGSSVTATNITTDLSQTYGVLVKSYNGTNATFTANSSHFDGVQSEWGGWLGNGTTSTITDCTFNNNGNGPNSAGNSDGLAVELTAQATIVNSQFNGNYGNGLVAAGNSQVTLEQDTFSGNEHGNGAIFLDQSTVDLVGNTFDSNGQIVSYGAGFNGVEFNSSFTGTATVTGNTFDGNTSFGMYVGGAPNGIQITGNTFQNNPTGIGLDGTGSSAVNVTITGNTFLLTAGTSNEFHGIDGNGSNATATIGGTGSDANVFENYADKLFIVELNQSGSQNVGYPNFNILGNSFLQNGQSIPESQAVSGG